MVRNLPTARAAEEFENSVELVSSVAGILIGRHRCTLEECEVLANIAVAVPRGRPVIPHTAT